MKSDFFGFFILYKICYNIYIYIINSFGFKKKIFLNIDKCNYAIIKQIENIVKHRNDKKNNSVLLYCLKHKIYVSLIYNIYIYI